MKLLKITNREGFFKVSDADYAHVSKYKWLATRNENKSYIARGKSVLDKSENREILYLHRLIAKRKGLDIEGKEVDHINGDSYDNRRCNLRVATRSQNCCNLGILSNNKSGHTNVFWDKVNNKWRSQIQFNHVKYHVGRFDSFEKAVSMAERAEKRYHGKFAKRKEK